MTRDSKRGSGLNAKFSTQSTGTLTGDSDLSRTGVAKRIMYAWGTGNPQVLRAVVEESKLPGHVALHYDHLLTALTRATRDFLEAANHDRALGARWEEAAGRHYLNISAPEPGLTADDQKGAT